MAHDIFISYSKKDIVSARHLRILLQQANFSVWMDENEIDPGEDWWETIEGCCWRTQFKWIVAKSGSNVAQAQAEIWGE